MSPKTYRAGAFLSAAETLGIDVISVVDMPQALREYWHAELAVSFANIEQAFPDVVRLAREKHVDALLSVDDAATELAALGARELGFSHNSPQAAIAARDKLVMRDMLAAAGVKCPWYRVFSADTDPYVIADSVPFPCVIKPLRLSGSRGVIRADNPDELAKAFARTIAITADDTGDDEEIEVLIEEYIPGVEVALEGLITDGELHVLALFDKPDPLVGPFFEETIYVTPSRLSASEQALIRSETVAAAAALGLRHGPIHAELRINEVGAWLVEIAGRSIGGLCSTILSFGAGMSLEEIILRHAVGMTIPSMDRVGGAVGVMMIPIPAKGVLRAVDDVDAATAIPGVTGIEITAPLNYPIEPLPEGASYLGFIFAKGESPAAVEATLREAHERLRIQIDAVVSMSSPAARR
ncbi:MAG: ATP-grasp domain-containing protein [Thermomicrobiales bacterium]|nr:ATP-grasp domain-containing protein [Thermomicrobiales bacterium]